MDEDKKSAACLEVLKQSSHRIYLEMRFLEQAIFSLRPKENERIFFGCDGENLYFEKEYLLKRYLQSPAQMTCDYLHAVVHCLYQHPFLPCRWETKYWDLASDIAVADVFGEMNVAWVTEQVSEECLTIVNWIKEEVPVMMADHIAAYLQEAFDEEEALFGYRYEELAKLFQRDSHACWHNRQEEKAKSGTAETRNAGAEAAGETGAGVEENGTAETGAAGAEAAGETGAGAAENGAEENGAAENGTAESKAAGAGFAEAGMARSGSAAWSGKLLELWKDIAQGAALDAESFSKGRGVMPGGMRQTIQKLTREQYDYTEFLRKFAVVNEKMKVNLDEFDYAYYMYGLRTFGKIPLIEPLEYKEEKQIKEFVIVLDTSGSCSGELVERFLNKTYNILCQTECFAEQSLIHIIQCDACVQQDVRIASLQDMEEYIEEMELLGGGGTDFRPAFVYVEELRQAGEFKKLCGLIYFTDGDGVFPEKPPDYKTAFVFVERNDDVRVPPWAMRLYLENV